MCATDGHFGLWGVTPKCIQTQLISRAFDCRWEAAHPSACSLEEAVDVESEDTHFVLRRWRAAGVLRGIHDEYLACQHELRYGNLEDWVVSKMHTHDAAHSGRATLKRTAFGAAIHRCAPNDPDLPVCGDLRR